MVDLILAFDTSMTRNLWRVSEWHVWRTAPRCWAQHSKDFMKNCQTWGKWAISIQHQQKTCVMNSDATSTSVLCCICTNTSWSENTNSLEKELADSCRLAAAVERLCCWTALHNIQSLALVCLYLVSECALTWCVLLPRSLWLLRRCWEKGYWSCCYNPQGPNQCHADRLLGLLF